jgi:ankyrin repeat protein
MRLKHVFLGIVTSLALFSGSHSDSHAMMKIVRNGSKLIRVNPTLVSQAHMSFAKDNVRNTAVVLDEETLKKNNEMLENVNFTDKHGPTPLIWATKYNNRETVKTLLCKGANVNHHDNTGALTFAVSKGHTDIVKQLIEANTDVNAKDNGWTPLMLATILGRTDIVKQLIEANADVNVQDKYGNTALILAVKNDSTGIVKQLIEANADVNAQSKNGSTALIFAARDGKTNIAKKLIEANADVNAQDKDGDTALIRAAGNSHTDSVQQLLTHPDINIGIENKRGKTALDIAEERNHTDIVELIEEYQQINNTKTPW